MRQKIAVFSWALTVLISAGEIQAAIPWALPQSLISDFTFPFSLAAADFNRDGSMDAVVANTGPSGSEGQVRILLGGSPGGTLDLATDRYWFKVLAVDIDQDGWTDVVGGENDSFYWWRNPGSGPAWTETFIAGSLFEMPQSMDAGDIDGDGDMDLLVAGIKGADEHITWFSNNNGSGTDWTYHDLYSGSVPGSERPWAALGDFDNDGLLDVAAVIEGLDEVAWLENQGLPSILGHDDWPRHVLDSSFTGNGSVAASDLDQDGDFDIVAGTSDEGDIVFFENEDAGTTWGEHRVGSYDGLTSLTTVDLDQDGDLDVLVTSDPENKVSWFRHSRPAGIHWFSAYDIGTGFSRAQESIAVDHDGDGDPDVLAVGLWAHEVRYWENLSIHRTAAFGDREEIATGSYFPTSMAMGDSDRDGDLELAVTFLNYDATDDLMEFSDGPAGWEAYGIDGQINGAARVRFADLDGDGKEDLLVAGTDDDEISWYRAPHLGKELVTLDCDSVADVDVADIDCDGDTDIFAATGTGQTQWYENQGGAFWIQRPMRHDPWPTAIRAFDDNRDGDPDLAVASSGDTSIKIVKNLDCTGGPWNAVVVDDSFDNVKELTVGDVNGDGRLDLVGASRTDGIRLWLRTSSGWNTRVVSSGSSAYSVQLVDMELDGDLDIVAAISDDGDVKWWSNNNGSGTSWSGKSNIDNNFGAPRGVAVGDMNKDGMPDVAALDFAGARLGVFESQGGQYTVEAFSEAPSTLGDGESASVLRLMPVHKGIPGDLVMELRTVHIGFENASGGTVSSAQANALIETLEVWHDTNGNGSFDGSGDTLLGSIDEPDLHGYPSTDLITIPHDDAHPSLGEGDFESYFVVVTATADASSQPMNELRLSHQNDRTSSHMNYYHFPNIALTPIPWNVRETPVIEFTNLAPHIFSDGFETANTGSWSDTVP